MKKLTAILLAAFMAFGFAGCGADNSANANATPEKTFVLGLDDAFPPMGYVDPETGDIVGFDIDLAKEACNRMGMELKLQPIDWNTKTAELANGNIDCLWNGFSKTEERERDFNLSMPYMQNNQIILVKSGSGYKTLADLAGKTLGVQEDSSAETALDKNEAFKSSLKEIVRIGDYSKAILEIKNGTIDAIAIDEVVARFYLKDDPDAYQILSKEDGSVESLAVEDYVIGFRKEDDALKEKVEKALQEMADDGTMTKISMDWFGEDVTIAAKK